MTADVVQGGGGKLDIGQVIGGTFQVVGRNIVTFAILGLLLSGLPTALIAFAQVQWLANSGVMDGSIIFTPAYFSNLGFGVLAALITTAILQGALIYATVQDMNGQKPSVAAALTTGFRNFLPLIIVSFLFAIGIGLGFVLLIVPGIMLGCAWCVAVPALVADRTGIFGAFGRSAELTRGNRWRIFGLFVLLWIILIIVSMVFGSISSAVVFSTPGALQNPIAAATNPVAIIVQVIQQTISAVLGAALSAVLYVELRRIRDGAGPQWLAEIFD